jgi:hypothetical protein
MAAQLHVPAAHWPKQCLARTLHVGMDRGLTRPIGCQQHLQFEERFFKLQVLALP